MGFISAHVARASRAPQALAQAASDAVLALYMGAGGDERIWIDPFTERTRYGTGSLPAEDEIWFSSASAANVDQRGFAAAQRALAAILGHGPVQFLDPRLWFDQIRARILAQFGIAGAEAILSASATEAEYVALSLARSVLVRPLTNIVIGADELGNGLLQAAAGRHFCDRSSLGGAVVQGELLAGFADANIIVRGIALRTAAGAPRPAAEIDRAAANEVAAALAAGRDVVLHVMDASPTGLGGLARNAARQIAETARGRMIVVVDAGQLRASPAQLKADLAAGFMVIVSGSKFAGGPPFAGALLVPPALSDEICAREASSTGLAAYSAAFDWPPALRRRFSGGLGLANLGLALRWEAALATIEPYFSVLADLRWHILDWFADSVRCRLAARPHLRLAAGGPQPAAAIFPVVTRGHAASPTGAAELFAALAASEARDDMPAALARACHVGEPVMIGGEAALRLSASMPMVLATARRIAEGQTIEEAFAPIRAELDLLFAKWDFLAGGDSDDF